MRSVTKTGHSLCLAVFGLFALLVLSVAGQSCGPKACYPNSGAGCTFAATPVDFVFFIDVSGSMRWKIDSVVTGLTSFSNQLASKNIDATYSVWDVATSEITAYQLGQYQPSSSTPWRGPRLRLSPTRDINVFQSLLTNSLSTRIYNFRESMLEGINMALGKAKNSNFNAAVSWRANSQRVFFILTDEDSDPAEFSANVYQADAEIRSLCYDDLVSQSRWTRYQDEIDDISLGLIQNNIMLYALVNPWGNSDTLIGRAERCLTEYQYGDPTLQSQSSDLSNFNLTRTLTNLRANTKARKSIQAQLLGNNVYSRVFDINQVSSSNFVNNFFQLVVTDVSSCSSCSLYRCASNSSCLPPTNICGCDGIPYSNTQTDCKGICGGRNVILTDCSNQASCRLPEEAIYTDCRGQCFDPTSGNTAFALDFCGECAQSGTNGTKYSSSCASKPLTSKDRCNDYTCGSKCVSSGTNCLTDCAGNKYPAGDQAPSVLNTCGRCVSFSSLAASEVTDRDLCNVCKSIPGYNATLCRKNCSGVYEYNTPTSKLINNCGVECRFSECLQDCAGAYYMNNTTPTNSLNSCGKCYATVNLAASETSDKDACGVCKNSVGYNASLCEQDCSGVMRYNIPRNVLYNQCGVRCKFDFCIRDCNSTYYMNDTLSPNLINDCGRCVARTNLTNENTADKDRCGVCKNIPGYNASLCEQDCSLTWRYNIPRSELYNPCGTRCSSNCFTDCANKTYITTPENVQNKCGRCVPSASLNESVANDTDACGVCKNSAGWSSTLCVDDCSTPPNKVYNPPSWQIYDNCGARCGKVCVQDCNGTYYNSTSLSPNLLNDCGRCVARTNLTNENNADKDNCGVCKNIKNYNASLCQLNCSGVYQYDIPRAKLFDSCNVRCGKNCVQDCNGNYYVNGTQNPPFTLNACGTCIAYAQVNVTTGKDRCGVCTNTPGYTASLCQLDCSTPAVYRYPLNESTLFDPCGVRCGTKCVQDCANNYYISGTTPPYSANRCGYCVPTKVADSDLTLVDACGVCNNTIGYNKTYCQVNCEGNYQYFPGGDTSSLLDSCGKRCGNNTRDKCGVCDGNVTVLNLDYQFKQCPCNGGTPVGVNIMCGKRICAGDVPPDDICSTNTTCTFQTSCGECLDNNQNLTLVQDDCGQCYLASDTSLRNQNMTSCGVCFGNEDDCKRCDNTTVCGAGNTEKSAAVCGNNVLEDGEECDAGPSGNSTCSASCTKIVASTNTGTIIGAVAGSVGAVMVAAGGFFAYQYAVKNGLLGKASQTIALGTNTNPLYESPVQKNVNPLYEQGTETPNPMFNPTG